MMGFMPTSRHLLTLAHKSLVRVCVVTYVSDLAVDDETAWHRAPTVVTDFWIPKLSELSRTPTRVLAGR
jgi:hypothetical protein